MKPERPLETIIQYTIGESRTEAGRITGFHGRGFCGRVGAIDSKRQAIVTIARHKPVR